MIVFFVNLGRSSIVDWDEGIYALISYDQARNFSLTLKLNQELWYEKPPLGFWLEALFIKLGGFNEITIRLFSSLCLTAAMFFIYFIGKRLYNQFFGLAITTLTILSPSLLHQHFARSGDLDAALLFGTVAVVLCLLKFQDKKIFFHLAILIASFTVMVRGVSGLLIFPLILLYLLFEKRYKKLKLIDWLIGILIGVIVILPWHIYHLIKSPNFWSIYFSEQFFSRVTTPLQGHSGPWYFYFQYFYLTLKWGIIFPLIGFGWYLYRWFKYKDLKQVIGVIWLLVFLIPLMIMKTKLNWYVMPLIPVVSLFTIDLFYQLIKYKLWIILSIASLMIIMLMFLYIKEDYNFVFNPKIAPISVLAERLRQIEPTGTKVVVYNEFGWYKGWLRPQADLYLNYFNSNKSYLIDDANREHYIAGDYDYFITNSSGLDKLNEVTNNNFGFELIAACDNILLLKKYRK